MAEQKKLRTLFIIMLKLGALTFGGGYAMVPLFEDEFVQKRGWLDAEDMVNMVALSQSVPGAIAINCGILIGYRLRKLKGALIATLGAVLPSLVSLTIITYIYEAVRENLYVAGALRGIRAAVVALLVSAFWRFTKPFRKDIVAIAAFVAAFLLSLLLNINSIYIILGAIAFGVTAGISRFKKISNGDDAP
ncbi:MAG: chromate transporter [Christensenellales bacterium]|jgi:chromate transporter